MHITATMQPFKKKYTAKNKSFWQRLLAAVKRVKAKLKSFLKNLGNNKDSAGEKTIKKQIENLDKLERKLIKAIRDFESNDKSNDFEVKFSAEITDDEKTEYEKPITIEDIKRLRSIGRKSINEFTSDDIKTAKKWAYKFNKEMGVKSPFFRAWFGDWRAYDRSDINITSLIKTINATNKDEAIKTIKEHIKNKTYFRGNVKNSDTGFTVNVGSKVYEDTLTYSNREYSRSRDFDAYIARVSVLQDIENIVKNSVLFDTEIVKSSEENPNRTFVHKFYTLTSVNKKTYIIKLIVDELNAQSGDIRRAYNVNNIEISPAVVSQVYKPAGTANDIRELISNISISQLFDLVKTYDKKFNPHPVNEALLNKDGTPKRLYHNTNNNFTAFDTNKSGQNQGAALGDGIYMSSSKTAYNSKDYGKYQMQLYANIRNPFEMELSEEQANYILEKYASKTHELDKYEGIYRQHALKALMDSDKVFNYLKEYAADNGVKTSDILKDLGYDGVHDGIQWVAFSGEQVKSATDNIGTYDKGETDIRFSTDSNARTDFSYSLQRKSENYIKTAEILQQNAITDTAEAFAKEYADVAKKYENAVNRLAAADKLFYSVDENSDRYNAAKVAKEEAEKQVNTWGKALDDYASKKIVEAATMRVNTETPLEERTKADIKYHKQDVKFVNTLSRGEPNPIRPKQQISAPLCVFCLDIRQYICAKETPNCTGNLLFWVLRSFKTRIFCGGKAKNEVILSYHEAF